MFYSRPGHLYFFNRISSWVKRQRGRLWCAVPFWDSVGMAMLNATKAQEIRIICRKGEVAKYLRKDAQVRWDPDLHSKMLIGDHVTLLGSFNMTYQSMFDNQENAVYSRSKAYEEFFLQEWEEAAVRPEDMPVSGGA